MGIIQVLLAILKGLGVIFSLFFEKNQAVKEQKKEALSEIEKGIKEKDATSVTAGFDRINRIR